MISIAFDPAHLQARLEAKARAARDNVRKAAQAGAQVYYDEVRARVPVSKAGHWFYGTSARDAAPGSKRAKAYWYDAGALRKAIYQVYANDHSTPTHALYSISWRKRGADSVPYGYMVEFGTSRSPGRPFLRPAYEAVHQRAVETVSQVIHQAISAA